MKNGLAIAFPLFLLLSNAACAEPDSSGECSGLSCVFEPIFKLGKSIIAPQPSPEKAPPPPQNTTPTPQAADTKPSEVDDRGADQALQKRPDSGETADAGDKLTLSKPHLAKRVRAASKLYGQSKHVAETKQTRTMAPAPAKHGGESILIAASEPELAQMTALASQVSDPTIKIVRSERCMTKPADFTVDSLQNIARLGPAIPLFSERLIILSRTGSADIASLRNRNVSFGMTGSSSQQIAQRLFSSQKVDVRETPLDLDNALDALALGEVDAVALLAPAGYTRFASHGPELKLISLGNNVVPPEGLKITRIDPSNYLGGRWSQSQVGLITVDAVLSPAQNPPRDGRALSIYAALDRDAPTLARSGFDLIGGDTLVTMRSVAEDPASRPAKPISSLSPAFVQDGC